MTCVEITTSLNIRMTKQVRHYASEIISLPNKELRQQALQEVPEELREVVRVTVIDHFTKKACFKNHLNAVNQQGCYARQTGISKSECPFHKQGGQLRKSWLNGWENEDNEITLQLGR